MRYYILMPSDTEKDTEFSTNILGEESFGYFYSEQGMNALYKIVNEHPELLDKLQIIDHTRKTYTLTEFFDKIASLKIRKQ